VTSATFSTAEQLAAIARLRYRPVRIDAGVEFSAGDHVYSWQGWNPPSVTRILSATGVSAFDPTFWLRSLQTRGIKAEQAEQWIEDLHWDGHDRAAVSEWVNQFVGAPMSTDDATVYMEWRRDSAAARGSRTHARIQHFFTGEQDAIPGLMTDKTLLARDSGWFDAFLRFFRNAEFHEVIAVEQPMINTVGVFCGTVDMAASVTIPELGDTGPVRRVLDWKTLYPPEGRVKGKPWQAMQMAAYGATLNRLAAAGITEAVNIHLFPGGYQLSRFNMADLAEAWRSYLGFLWEYWSERRAMGLMYHSPAMAAQALEGMAREWGPFA